jgi:hypothetical protein
MYRSWGHYVAQGADMELGAVPLGVSNSEYGHG